MCVQLGELKMIKKIPYLRELGPLLAGAQVAFTFAGFMGLGALADWVVAHWFPFTRWVWSGLFDWLRLPELTAAEQDALTTLAFFLPLAISSFVFREDSEQRVDVDVPLRRFVDIGIGFIILYIMAGSVFEEALNIIDSTDQQFSIDFGDTEINNPVFFMVVGIFYAGFAFLNPQVIFTRMKERLQRAEYNSKINPFVSAYIRFLDANSKFIRPISLLSGLLMIIFSIFVIAGPYVANAAALGILIFLCIFLILISLGVSVVFDPSRILKTAGVVIAIVLMGIIWELGMAIVHFIETVPTDS